MASLTRAARATLTAAPWGVLRVRLDGVEPARRGCPACAAPTVHIRLLAAGPPVAGDAATACVRCLRGWVACLDAALQSLERRA